MVGVSFLHLFYLFFAGTAPLLKERKRVAPRKAAQKTPGGFGGHDQGNGLMPTGTVKWFNTTKGYGFIAPDEGGKDVFVHISAVEKAGLTGLADNMKIGYELVEGRDGRQHAGELQAL